MYCAYVEQKKAVDCKVLRIYVHGREKGGGGNAWDINSGSRWTGVLP